MKKKKLRKGKLVTSLDQLMGYEWVFVHGIPYHDGWVMSWSFGTAAHCVNERYAYEGVRLTNGEYYKQYADEQLKNRFSEELHTTCPWKHIDHAATSTCDGQYCDEALGFWKEEPVK